MVVDHGEHVTEIGTWFGDEDFPQNEATLKFLRSHSVIRPILSFPRNYKALWANAYSKLKASPLT